MVSRRSLGLSSLMGRAYDSFEHMDCQLDTRPKIRVVLIYRPPCGAFNTFIEELEDLLERLSVVGGELILLGDFNVHFEDLSSHQSCAVRDLCNIYSFRLLQHVRGATHRHGHTLDLLFTRSDTSLGLDISVQDLCISDHNAVFCDLSLSMRDTDHSELVEYRCLKRIDPAALMVDISQSPLCRASLLGEHPDIQVGAYCTVLNDLLQQHAPLKRRRFTSRPSAPWYSDELRNQKQLQRKAERKWRKSGLQVD